MGTPQLLYGLALILLIQTVPSQSTDSNSLMMQKSAIRIRGALRTQLETQPSNETSTSATTLQNNALKHPFPLFSGPARKRPKRLAWDRSEEQECRLRSLLLPVKDLGLGYSSEEPILFKYCSGSCPKTHGNHDLVLAFLLQNRNIPALADPCCRPTHYENIVFLEGSHQWLEVEKISASACSCMG